MPRLFLALWPEPALAGPLAALAEEVGRRGGGRRMRPETLHLTLAFLGDVAPERVPELLAALGGIHARPFTLCLDTLGHWRHNHIVWAGCSVLPEELGELVAELRAVLTALALPLPDKAFVPHLTLLRKAPPDGVLPTLVPLAWPVGEWVLVESCLSAAGADYRLLARWPLSSAGA